MLGTVTWMCPAIACEYPDSMEPSSEARRYENTQLGLAFQIPANYRTMGRQGGKELAVYTYAESTPSHLTQ